VHWISNEGMPSDIFTKDVGGQRQHASQLERVSETASIPGMRELDRCRELDRLLSKILLVSPEVSMEMSR
jgi:hypothetical protein